MRASLLSGLSSSCEHPSSAACLPRASAPPQWPVFLVRAPLLSGLSSSCLWLSSEACLPRASGSPQRPGPSSSSSCERPSSPPLAAALVASMANSVFTWAVSTLREVVSTLSRFEDGRDIPEDVLDALLIRVELAYHDILA